MQIRTYLKKDFQAIADIYNESISLGGVTLDFDLYSPANIEKAFIKNFNHRETILVSEQDSQVIGWGIIKHYNKRPGYNLSCETSIYLSFSNIGRGYGYALQTALLEKVQAFGYHHVVAKILVANSRSIKFHQKFGYEIVGIQKEIGYYQGKWLDVAILQLIFADIPSDIR